MGRKTVAVMMACMLVVALAGCSKKKSDDSAANASSTTTTASSSDNSSTTTTSGSSTDASDLNNALDGLGASGDCIAIASSYAAIYLSALGASDDATKQQLEDQLNQIKGKVPSNIQSDLDVIANGIRNADGLTGLGKFFDSDEYKKANQEITDYLDQTCGTGSNN
jgi:hypothetical protein